MRPGAVHLPSPFLVLASLARSTSLALGTGVTLAPAWHPLWLAYDAAILDQLSGGRFILGMGAGDPATWRRFGADRQRIGEFMDELLAVLKALWSGPMAFAAGWSPSRAALLPAAPGRQPASVGRRRAAALGDAWNAATSYALATIRGQAERYRSALEHLGRPLEHARVSVHRLACLADSPERAWSEGGRYVEGALEQYAAMGGLPSPERGPGQGARMSPSGWLDPAARRPRRESVPARIAGHGGAAARRLRRRRCDGRPAPRRAGRHAARAGGPDHHAGWRARPATLPVARGYAGRSGRYAP